MMTDVARQIADVAHLLRFRASTIRRPRLAGVALASLVAITLAFALLPGVWAGELAPQHRARIVDNLPAILVAVALLTVSAAVAAAGGRELLARDPATVHPIGPVTDHLGALLLAPMSAAWLLQTWGLLVCSALVAEGSATAAVVALAWVAAATALGQAFAWTVEWVRRGPRGVLVVRWALAAAVATVLALGVGEGTREAALAGPAGLVADAILGERSGPIVVAGLVVATILLTFVGAVPAAAAGRRLPRDESRIETASHRPRPLPRSDHHAALRLDRASVWRSVPLRRGAWFLALGPGVVALVSGMDWESLMVLPGLVASGCALLFAVNVWCLDGRGMLWRESLPVTARTVFWARCHLVVEVLIGAGAVTILLGAVRAGVPSPTEALGVTLTLLVVSGQALSGSMRWSLASPYAVDLRSARATPAPPLTMIGYSVRLALATTVTAMLLIGLALGGLVTWMVGVALVLLVISASRVLRAARRWDDPVERARVVATVVG